MSIEECKEYIIKLTKKSDDEKLLNRIRISLMLSDHQEKEPG